MIRFVHEDVIVIVFRPFWERDEEKMSSVRGRREDCC